MSNIRQVALAVAVAAVTIAVPFIVNPQLFADPCPHTAGFSILCPLGQSSCSQCLGMCGNCTETQA